MATQAEVDALGVALDQASTDLAASVAAVQAELNALASANPSIDLSAVSAKVAALDEAAKAVGSLAPIAVTP